MGSDRVPRASPAPSGVNVVCSPNKSSKEGSGGGRVGGGSGREGQVLLLHLLRGFPLGGVSCYLLGMGVMGGGLLFTDHHHGVTVILAFLCCQGLPASNTGPLGNWEPIPLRGTAKENVWRFRQR